MQPIRKAGVADPLAYALRYAQRRRMWVPPGHVDRSLLDGGVWERASFTVPKGTPEERVQFHADTYMRKAGVAWEAQGFTVLRMNRPVLDNAPLPEEPDRTRYVIRAWLTRRPVTMHIDIPETAIPQFQGLGLRLAE